MAKDFRIIVLISGRGSNLKSLISHQQAFSIVGVLSNKPEALGLDAAKTAGIPCFPFDRASYPSLAAMKTGILAQARLLKPDLVVLAGYMQIIEPEFLAAFPHRVINIHPSLLPAYPGIDTHARALAAKERYHGCSVHVVDAGVDTGSLIAQARCECKSSDDPESLAARVLTIEHRLLPWVVTSIARGDIQLGPSRIQYSPRAREESRLQEFTIFS